MVLSLPLESIEAIQSCSGSLELVHFLAPPNDKALQSFLNASQSWLSRYGGTRRMTLATDMALSGFPEQNNKGPFSVFTVDAFPDSKQALDYLQEVSLHNENAPPDFFSYMLVLKPEPSMKILAVLRKLYVVQPLLGLLFPVDRSLDFKPDVHLNQPERNATQEKLDEFRTRDLKAPFYNINLNRFYDPPQDGVSKEEYYKEFSQETAKITGPRLLGLGAYPAVSGNVLTVLEDGSPRQHSLQDQWDNFLLVYYPQRQDYLDVIPSFPDEIVEQRAKAYQRGVQIPSVEYKGTSHDSNAPETGGQSRGIFRQCGM
ncbi:expressed unknown protein [Seminavis robusta]|uniref:Uncharacterized protein n=1 Tax=Seminavis robusta TaxID=568900 RepID=A0A9N8E3F4_9STRA|nr:expressed unknown protein [Seminavis robusta]|eukprot:Sro578_g169810.1 n/a (315) ;mRNA; r:19138-20082